MSKKTSAPPETCGKLLKKGQNTSALGHNWGAGVVVKEATVDATGVKRYTCTRCKVMKEETIPKIDEDNKLLPGFSFVDEKTKAEYVVIDTVDGSKQVQYKASIQKNAQSVAIPSEITMNGEKYTVTQIAAGAFKNCKALKKVTISKNVTSIGKKAFYNCKNLKMITIKSKQLKSVGASAFIKIADDSVIKISKNKTKQYKKLLAKKYSAKKTKIK